MQSNHREVVNLGPISMGERLRIGGDISSDDDMDEATPSPAPSSPKRSHKRRVLPPRSLDDSEFFHAFLILIVTFPCRFVLFPQIPAYASCVVASLFVNNEAEAAITCAGEQGAVKTKRKYTKRAEKWKYTKKAQARAAATAAAPAGADVALPADDAEMPEGASLLTASVIGTFDSLCPQSLSGLTVRCSEMRGWSCRHKRHAAVCCNS